MILIRGEHGDIRPDHVECAKMMDAQLADICYDYLAIEKEIEKIGIERFLETSELRNKTEILKLYGRRHA